MKIEKAIEILKDRYSLPFEVDELDLSQAIKLGIEALKRIKEGRKGYNMSIVDKLPGETKEEE